MEQINLLSNDVVFFFYLISEMFGCDTKKTQVHIIENRNCFYSSFLVDKIECL